MSREGSHSEEFVYGEPLPGGKPVRPSVTSRLAGVARQRSYSLFLLPLVFLACRDTAAPPSVSRVPSDICAGKTVALDLLFTVREASPAAGLLPSALIPIRLTFRPNAASGGAEPGACSASGTVTTSKPLPLSAPDGVAQPVTFSALMEESLGGVRPVVYIEQGDVISATPPSGFRGVLFTDVAAGLWFANAGADRSARGDLRVY